MSKMYWLVEPLLVQGLALGGTDLKKGRFQGKYIIH